MGGRMKQNYTFPQNRDNMVNIQWLLVPFHMKEVFQFSTSHGPAINKTTGWYICMAQIDQFKEAVLPKQELSSSFGLE